MRMLRSPPARLPTRLRLLPALLLPALLASAPLAAQQVYKWKDAAGVTHFTSEPPPKGQYEAREVDHHEAAPVATGGDAAGTTARGAEDPGCATARNNLKLLAGEGTLSMDTDGSGKPKVLSDADRTRQRNLAQAIIDAKCSAAPAQAPEPEEQ
jgi:hypothetical protein